MTTVGAHNLPSPAAHASKVVLEAAGDTKNCALQGRQGGAHVAELSGLEAQTRVRRHGTLPAGGQPSSSRLP